MSTKRVIQPNEVDKALSAANPWGLTPRQCAYMRMLCEIGSHKAIAIELGSARATEYYAELVRTKMGLRGNDARMVAYWVTWLHDFKRELLPVFNTHKGAA